MRKLFLVIVSICMFISTLDAKELKLNLLDKKEQATIAISAFTAKGEMDRLKVSFIDGLEAGLSINEIKEIAAHLYAYVGFPRSLNAQNLFMEVVKSRKDAGKKDIEGKVASAKPKDYDPIEYGKKIRAKLVGIEKDYTGAPYQVFSPIIDEYLLAHLFGDIFVRDVLNHKQRELVTISALAVLSGAESQLKFHMGAAMRVGNSKLELKEFVEYIKLHVDKKQGKIAENIFDSL